MILQRLHDLTDEQTLEAIALNIAWHYALDIRHDFGWNDSIPNLRREDHGQGKEPNNAPAA
jgi:hypothetical protein